MDEQKMNSKSDTTAVEQKPAPQTKPVGEKSLSKPTQNKSSFASRRATISTPTKMGRNQAGDTDRIE